MGMDLIGAGYTIDTTKEYEKAAVEAALGGIPDHDLIEALDRIDPSGGDLDTYEPTEIRETLLEAFKEYEDARYGHRMTAAFNVPGTRLHFVFAGGGSWGDEPFEGFSQLEYAINTCAVFPEVAKAVGFICWGLPSPDVAKEYPEKKQE